MTMTPTNLTSEFAAVLKCREKYISTRLAALGHNVICNRCGGSGSYSYCQMYGTTCFGCGGSGGKAPKLTDNLLETVRQQVAAGELEPYLRTVKQRAMSKKWIDRLFVAWAAQPEIAADKAAGKHWMQQTELCAKINSINAPLVDRLNKLAALVTYGTFSKETRKYIPATDAEIEQASIEAEAMIERATNSQKEAEAAK